MNEVWKKLIEYLVSLITERMDACRLIRADKDKDIKPIVETIITNILYLNQLKDLDVTVYSNNMPLKDIMILNDFVPFIYPSSVRYFNGDLRSNDLLIRPYINSVHEIEIEEVKEEEGKKVITKKPGKDRGKQIDYFTFYNAQTKFRGFVKDKDPHFTSLDSLKITKSLADVINIAGFIIEDKDDKGNIKSTEILEKYDAEPFIPIVLNKESSLLFRDDYFNADAFRIIKDYFNKVKYN